MKEGFMKKNILFFVIGALVMLVLGNRPIFADGPDLTNAAFAMSGREFAIVDRSEAVVYYYEKSNGQFLRAHRIRKFGTSMTPN